MKRTAKRWWTRLVTVLAALTVAAATLSAGFAVLIDAVPGWRTDIEQQVSRAVGHPARIGSMALTWSGLRPTLDLRAVALFEPAGDGIAPLASLRRLRLGLSPTRMLFGPRVPDRVEIDGLRVTVRIGADGRARIDGFALAPAGQRQPLDAVARYAQGRLHDIAVTVVDARLGNAPLEGRINRAELHHDRAGYHLEIEATAPPAVAGRAHLAAQFDGSLDAPETLNGRWTLRIDGLAGWPWLAPLMASGAAIQIDGGAVEASGAIAAGAPGAAALRLRASALVGRLDGQALARLAEVDLDLRAQPVEAGWQLALPHGRVSGARGAWPLDGLQARLATDGSREVLVPLLRLDDLAPWLPLLRTPTPKRSRLVDLRGELVGLRVERGPKADDGSQPPALLRTGLRGIGLDGAADQVGFAALDGVLEARGERGVLTLTDSPLTLRLPQVFAQPLPVDAVAGTIGWERLDGYWRIASEDLAVRVASSTAQGAARLRVHEDGAVPDLRIDLRLQSEAVAEMKPWMPIYWGANSRAWLERAVQRARVTGGRLTMDAPLTPRDEAARSTVPVRLTLDIADATLAYAPDWPVAEGIRAQLAFHAGGLDIVADGGSIAGLDVGALKATIADLRDAHLELDADFRGDAEHLYRLFRESPLRQRLSALTARTEARGPVRGDLRLRLPLNVPQPPVDASGRLELDGVELAVRGLAEPIRDVRGHLDYGRSIAAERIDARLHDTALRLRIATPPEAADPVLEGEFLLEPGRNDGLAADFIPAWLRSGLSGSSEALLRLPLGGADGGRLRIDSTLHGVASVLPPPLAKHGGARLPLQLQLDRDEAGSRLRIAVADAVKATLRFADAEDPASAEPAPLRAIEVRLGDQPDYPAAQRDGLVLSGAPDSLDLAGWIGVIAARGDGEGRVPPFVAADLQPARTVLRRIALGPSRLLAEPLGSDGIRVRLDGAATGTVDWLPADGGSVRARFDTLALDALAPLPVPPAGVAPPESPFNPTRAPSFDIDAAAFSVGGVALGRLQVATQRVPDGQRIERLAITGGRLDGSASGVWRRRESGERDGSSADLRFELRSDAIADVLRVFGYTPNLAAEDARFSGDVVWPRVPAGLELSQATGRIDLRLRRGQLKAVEPGAGRVLGLVNLYALPRRLLFDFRDVVDEGLRFDKLDGAFQLADGNATTDDLDIEGTAVRIEMRGRIGLAARDYDQQVTVFPDISTGVTVGATLLGGPIAGGILLVAQQLFDKPFNQLGSFRYRVTGSWDDPTVLEAGAPAVEPIPDPEPRNG